QTKEKTAVDVEFSVKEFISKLFDCFANENVLFDYEKAKPIVYSHVLTDEKPENLDILIRHLNKNYKNSYKFDGGSDSVPLIQPFENSYWTASLNGATNLSFLTGDSITDEFFKNNFYYKTKETYYFLFLNILHQKNAIMRIMGEIGKLDRLEKNYQVMKDQLKLARKYEAEAINLKFRGFFKFPSTIEHVNDYYGMLYNALKIEAFYNNFSTDIKNLKNICDKYFERIKERDEKFKQLKACKTEIFVSIFGTIVAEVTVLNSSWALIEKVLGKNLSFFSPAILILFATVLSPIVTIFLSVRKQRQLMKQLKNAIHEEEDDGLVENDKDRRKEAKLSAKTKKKSNH
ncbi:MAG: hypothetical protein J6V66_03745, partial [Clostridia bacterium]|nr:hypothetical protein [Clostridia bacterium]